MWTASLQQSQKYNLINFYLLFLVFLEHTVGVEHGGVLHLFNIRAWLRSLEDEKKKRLTQVHSQLN